MPHCTIAFIDGLVLEVLFLKLFTLYLTAQVQAVKIGSTISHFQFYIHMSHNDPQAFEKGKQLSY